MKILQNPPSFSYPCYVLKYVSEVELILQSSLANVNNEAFQEILKYDHVHVEGSNPRNKNIQNPSFLFLDNIRGVLKMFLNTIAFLEPLIFFN